MVGATVARETGLKVGDKFQPAHGAVPRRTSTTRSRCVGVLKPTGTPNDRAVFINMEGFYLIPEHAKPLDDEHAPAKQPEPAKDAVERRQQPAASERCGQPRGGRATGQRIERAACREWIDIGRRSTKVATPTRMTTTSKTKSDARRLFDPKTAARAGRACPPRAR